MLLVCSSRLSVFSGVGRLHVLRCLTFDFVCRIFLCFREKMESQLEKEARFCQLMAHSSHDSAIDTDSLEWETEVVEFEKDRVRAEHRAHRGERFYVTLPGLGGKKQTNN